MSIVLLFGLVCCGVGMAAAQLELKVGREGLSWLEAQDSLAFVNMAPDSLWTWGAEPGENLMEGVLARGGQILVSEEQPSFDPFGESILWPVFRDEITSVRAIADGDPATAYDPDELGQSRQVAIYVDLGGAFTIERTRLYPRLDTEHVGAFPQTFDLGLGDRLRPVVSINRLLTTSDVRFQRFIFYG